MELIYSLSLLPTTDVVLGYNTIVLSFIEKMYPEDDALEDFLGHVESTYL